MSSNESGRECRWVALLLGLGALGPLGFVACGDASDATVAHVDATGVTPTSPDTLGDGIGDASNPSGALSIVFLSPEEEGQKVGGFVRIVVELESQAEIAAFVLSQPPGLVDRDPSPKRIEALWDVAEFPEGPYSLTARATTSEAEIVSASRAVEVVHEPRRTLAGLASLGRKVRDADVEVVGFAGDGAGELLGVGRTSAAGFFELNLVDRSGLALVRVHGPDARYAELSGEGDAVFGPDDALLALVDLESVGEEIAVNVHALSTLAVGLAQAYAGDPRSALLEANGNLSAHLSRPTRFVPAIMPVADLTDGAVQWPSNTAALGLLHVGLSELALESGMSTVALVKVLARDLEDALFDGLDDAGEALVLADGSALDADTTRWRLAAATDRFIDDGPKNASGLTYDELAADDGYYTLISTDTGPLYPSEVPPKRFDERVPEVSFVVPTPAAGEFLGQSFGVRVEVRDPSKLASLELLAPAAIAVSEVVVDLGAKTLTATIDPRKLADGLVTVLARAEDVSGNAAQAGRDVVIDTTPPEVTLDPLTVFASGETTVTGSVADARAGVASVAAQVDGFDVETQLEDGVFWAQPAWSPGEHSLRVEATDGAGNVGVAEAKVFYDPDTPTLTFIGPVDGAFVPGAPFDVRIEVDDASAIQEVRVSVGDAQTMAALAAGDWVAEVEPPGEDGSFEVLGRAVDAAGNVGLGAASYVRDGTAPVVGMPVVLGAVDGPNSAYMYTNQDESTVEILATDDGSGVVSVCTTTPCDGLDLGGGWWRMTVDTSQIVQEYTYTATDAVGNQGVRIRNIRSDRDPPEYCDIQINTSTTTTDNPLFVRVLAQDSSQGVGMAGVTITNGDFSQEVVSDVQLSFHKADVPLLPGVNVLTATCRDRLGNSVEAEPLHVTLDEAPPTVVLISPQDGDWLSGDPVTVVADVSDDVGLQSVVLKLGTAIEVAMEPPDEGSLWQGELPGNGSGQNQVSIVALDEAGQTTTVSFIIWRDPSAPTIESVTLPDGLEVAGEWYTAQTTTTVRVVATDSWGGMGTVCSTTPCNGVQEGESTWNLLVNTSNVETAVLLTAEDAVGNQTTLPLAITRDSEGPVCGLEAPVGVWTVAAQQLLVALTASDPVGVSAVQVAVDGEVVEGTVGATGWMAVLPLQAGANTLIVTCVDALGNARQTLPKTVYLDSDGPVLTALWPLDDTWVGPGEFQARVDADDVSGVTSVWFTLATGAAAATEGPPDVWTALVTPPAVDGPFDMVIDALDVAQNARSLTVTPRRDGTAPVVAGIGVTNGVEVGDVWWTAADTANLLVSATDAGSGVAAVSVGGVAGSAGAVDTWAVGVPAPATAGALDVVAVDQVGNSATGAVTIARDMAAPTCVLVAPVGGIYRNETALELVVQSVDGAGVGVLDVALELNGGLFQTLAPSGDGVTFSVTLSASLTTFRAKCRDRVGNFDVSEELDIVLDIQPPLITDVVPASGTVVGVDPFAVSFKVVDANPGSALIRTSGPGAPATSSDGINWSGQATPPQSDGLFVLFISASDKAGNTSSQTPQLIRDGTAPTIEAVVVPSTPKWNETYYLVPSKDFTVEVTATDAVAGVASVTVFGVPAQPKGGGVWAAHLTDMPEMGPSWLPVVVTDAVGNTTTMGQGVRVAVDSMPPAVCTIEAPDGTVTIDAQGRHWIGSTSSFIGGEAVDQPTSGGLWVDVYYGSATEPTHTSETFNGTWSMLAQQLPKGQTQLSIVCRDMMGHTATDSLIVYVDTEAPTVTMDPYIWIDETGAAVSVDANVVQYDFDQNASTVNFAGCTPGVGTPYDWVCGGTFGKFSTNLEYSAPTDILDNNLPGFRPNPSEEGSSDLNDSQITVEYRFERANLLALMAWRALPPSPAGTRMKTFR